MQPPVPPRSRPPGTLQEKPTLPKRMNPPSPPHANPQPTLQEKPPIPRRMMPPGPHESACAPGYHRRAPPLAPVEGLAQHSSQPPLPTRQGELAERPRRRPPPQPPQYPQDRSTPSSLESGNNRPSQPSREYRTELPPQSPSLRADSPTQHVPQRPPPPPPVDFPDSPAASSLGYGSLESSRGIQPYGPPDSPTQIPPGNAPAPPGERAPKSAQVFFPGNFTAPSSEFTIKGAPSSPQDDNVAGAMYSPAYYPPRGRKEPSLSPSARPIHRQLVTTPNSAQSAAEADSSKADGAQAMGGNRNSFLHMVGKATDNAKIEPEEYFQTDTVLGLNSLNFDEFIKKHNKTLVMFFHSLKTESFYPSKEFASASVKSRHNQNHVFAAVDCYTESNLCCKENAKQLPMIKLYSNGFLVSSLSTVKDFSSDQMNMLVNMAPVLTQPRR